MATNQNIDLPAISTGEFREVARDFFTGETFLTFSGVFGGISVGELMGTMVADRWSGGTKLAVNVGGKSGASIVTRYATKGRGALDVFGMATAAGLGASAVSDVVAFALDQDIGFEVLANRFGGFAVPSLPKPPKNGEDKEERRVRRVKIGRSNRTVPGRRLEESPVEDVKVI